MRATYLNSMTLFDVVL